MADAPVIPESFQLADSLIADLLGDPDLGPKVRARAREKFPDKGLKFAQDAIDPVVARVEERLAASDARAAALEEALAGVTKTRGDEKRASDFTGQLQAARSKYRLTDAGFEMAVERMRETNAFDPDAAAAWAAMQNPEVKTPNKTVLGSQYANIFAQPEDNAAVHALYKDPDGSFLDRHFQAMLDNPEAYMAGDGPAV